MSGGCGRVFLFATQTEDTHALRLTSELVDLRAGYVHRHSVTPWAYGTEFKPKAYSSKGKKKWDPEWNPIFLWRCRPDLNRRITVLQTGALPLGYCTKFLIALIL